MLQHQIRGKIKEVNGYCAMLHKTASSCSKSLAIRIQVFYFDAFKASMYGQRPLCFTIFVEGLGMNVVEEGNKQVHDRRKTKKKNEKIDSACCWG